MLNFQICGAAAVLAFILSLLIGLLGRRSMPGLLIRPVLFAAVFSAVTAAVQMLAARFLPELLDKDGPDGDITVPGSRIDITEDVTPPASAQAFFGANADDSGGDLGDISDLVRGRKAPSPSPGGGTPAGMDQNRQDGYNDRDNAGEFPGAGQPPGETFQEDPFPSNGVSAADGTESGGEEFPGAVDILPDLESMAGAFMPSMGNEEQDTTVYSVSTPPPKPPSGGKSGAWPGDFNAKDIAAGLRTVLNKDKEG